MCVFFQEEPPLAKITRDSGKITVEQVHGLMSHVSKHNSLMAIYSVLVHESVRFTLKSFTHPSKCSGYQRHLVQSARQNS